MSRYHVELLREARRTLARNRKQAQDLSEREMHICPSLEQATELFAFSGLHSYNEQRLYLNAKCDLIRHINHLLTGGDAEQNNSLEAWLMRHGHTKANRHAFSVYDCPEWSDAEIRKLQRTRLAWIDWLIEYWRDQP